MTSPLDGLLGEIQAIGSELRSAIDHITRLGGVNQLAGNPGAIHRAANEWRAMAGDLRRVADEVNGDARHILAGSWEERTAGAFARAWRGTDGSLATLAADLDRSARGLDDAAIQIAGPAHVLEAVIGDIESLLAAVEAARDPATILAAAQHAPALIGQLNGLLHSIESAWSALSGWLMGLALAFEQTLGQVPALAVSGLTRVAAGWGQVVGSIRSDAGVIGGKLGHIAEEECNRLGAELTILGSVWPTVADLLPRAIAYALGFRLIEKVVGNKTYYIATGRRILDGSLLGRWIMSGRLPGTRYAARGVVLAEWVGEASAGRMLTGLVDFGPRGLRLAAKGGGPAALVLAAAPDVWDYSPWGPKRKLGYGADFAADVIIDEGVAGGAVGVGALAGLGAGMLAGGTGGTAVEPGGGTAAGAVVGGIAGTATGIAAGLGFQGYMLANPDKHEAIHGFVRDRIVLHPGDSIGAGRSWIMSHLHKSADPPPGVRPHPTPGPHPAPR